jgi:hypothetical protein
LLGCLDHSERKESCGDEKDEQNDNQRDLDGILAREKERVHNMANIDERLEVKRRKRLFNFHTVISTQIV